MRWGWVNFQCRGVIQFGLHQARAYCACSRCGWGLFGPFYSHLSFLSSSPSLGDGRYRLKYCLKGPSNPKTTNRPTIYWPKEVKPICFSPYTGGGRVVRWCWVNSQCRGDYSRARAYCACSRCGWGWFGHFYSHLSFLLFLPLFGRRPDID